MAEDILGRRDAGLGRNPQATAVGALNRLVVDASAAVHLVSLPQPQAALQEFESFAPPLMWSESLSALLEGALRGVLPWERLAAAVARLEALPVAVAGGDVDHRRRAIELARSLGWAKTYDAEYVALAQRMSCALLTADARLSRRVAGLVEVIGPASL